MTLLLIFGYCETSRYLSFNLVDGEMNQLKPKKELLNANYDVMLQLILTIAKLAGRKHFGSL